MLQQALEVIPQPREDAPAEAGMRDDLTEKLRQVEAQIEAQAKQAGQRQDAGPREVGPRPTTPTCDAAESVTAAAEAEASAAAGPSDQASSDQVSSDQAPVARLLLELSDDLLLVCTACASHVHRMCIARAPHVHRMCTACAPHLWPQEILCHCAAHTMHVRCRRSYAMHVHCRRSYASWAWLTYSERPRAAACSAAPVPRAAAMGRGTGCARRRGRD